MAKKVVWTPEAEKTFNSILNYLDIYWTDREKISFVRSTDKIIRLISRQPFLFRRVLKTPLREALITKHNLLLYYVRLDRIDIITFWDTRQNPKRKGKKVRKSLR